MADLARTVKENVSKKPAVATDGNCRLCG